MSEKSNQIHETLEMLKYQYPAYSCTFGECMGKCGNSARGGGWCMACISAKLVDYGVSKSLVDAINAALSQRQALSIEILGLCDRAVGVDG